MISHLPYAFIVPGPAISFQTKNRRSLAKWKEKIEKAALKEWNHGCFQKSQELQISITYLYSDFSPDADNLVKPIQDALIGKMYQDDSAIINVFCRKRNKKGPCAIKNASKLVATGLSSYDDFLHITISIPTDNREIEI